jgi:hypothetical protein
MNISEKIDFYENCFDDLIKEFARYDFNSEYNPKMMSLILAINDRIDRLRVIQRHQEKSFNH